MADEVPILVAPASIKALKSSRFLIPPAALICLASPNICFHKIISSSFAPSLAKPVDVLIKSASDSKIILAANSFCS